VGLKGKNFDLPEELALSLDKVAFTILLCHANSLDPLSSRYIGGAMECYNFETWLKRQTVYASNLIHLIRLMKDSTFQCLVLFLVKKFVCEGAYKRTLWRAVKLLISYNYYQIRILL